MIGGFGVSGVVGSMGSGLFRSIAPFFKSSDFGFVNLESPLTYGGDPQGWKDVVIKGNPALAPAMAKSGINVVTMANNHAGDMGDSGLLDSFKYCKKAGITVVGAGKNLKAAQAGAVLKTDGARTAFLGFSDVLPVGYPATSTSPGTSPGRANINAVKANIRAAAKKADYVFVGWHWNFEYKRAPSYLESSEGKAAIDAGADIVFAHHPHLLDGVQAYHGGLICYSLGNLVFSGFAGETAQTMLVRAKVSEHGIDAQLIPVAISGSGVPSVADGSQAEHPAAREELLRRAGTNGDDQGQPRLRARQALMRPVLFQIGGYKLYSFGLMAALALIVPSLMLVRPLLRRRGVTADLPTSSSWPPPSAAGRGAHLLPRGGTGASVKADLWNARLRRHRVRVVRRPHRRLRRRGGLDARSPYPLDIIAMPRRPRSHPVTPSGA